MRLSTRARYAVRAVLDLALQNSRAPVPVKEIAQRQEISSPYVEILLVQLRKSGIVRSVRGPKGGYLLGKAPAEVRIGDIVRVVEGPLSLTLCLEPGPEGRRCNRAPLCATRLLWERVSKRMAAVLDETTLEDLRRDALALAQSQEVECVDSLPRASRK